jgi:lipoprotein-releasing system permease protein
MAQRAIERPFGAFERMLAVRYLRAKREHGGLALISIVSVIGITLATMALIIVMSIMNGFRLELVSTILGFEPHVYIDTRGYPQAQVDAIIQDVEKRPEVLAVEPLLEGTVLAQANGVSEGVQLKGTQPEDIRKNQLILEGMARMRADGRDVGSLERFGQEGGLSKDVVIGDSLAGALGLQLGDRLKLTQVTSGPRTVVGAAGGRSRTFIVSGVFRAGNERYDRYTVILPIEAAKLFMGEDEGYPTLGVRIKDPDSAAVFQDQLRQSGVLYSTTWIDRQGSYIRALNVERYLMALILFIVVIITALNIVTGVLMLVKNKTRDVAILRTLGATRSGVVRIFLMTGTLLGMVGVMTGVVIGVLFCLNIGPIQHFLEWLFRFELFPKDVYMLDQLPAKVQPVEVLIVATGAFLVTLLMSIVPSMWAARLNPVEALRFE